MYDIEEYPPPLPLQYSDRTMLFLNNNSAFNLHWGIMNVCNFIIMYTQDEHTVLIVVCQRQRMRVRNLKARRLLGCVKTCVHNKQIYQTRTVVLRPNIYKSSTYPYYTFCSTLFSVCFLLVKCRHLLSVARVAVNKCVRTQ